MLDSILGVDKAMSRKHQMPPPSVSSLIGEQRCPSGSTWNAHMQESSLTLEGIHIAEKGQRKSSQGGLPGAVDASVEL